MALELTTKEIITIILLIMALVIILLFVLDHFGVMRFEVFHKYLGLGDKYGRMATDKA